ncbi:hypothetical protein [Mycobacteroides abscessus]
MSDAQKLILETLRKTLPPFDGFDHACAVAATEVDKALGGLTPQWAVKTRFGDLVSDVDRDTALYANESDDGGCGLSRWVSGWTVTE